MITKNAQWEPATLTDANLPNDAIPYVITPHISDAAVMCRLDIIAMKASRETEGLVTGTATQAEWDEAVRNFRVTP